MTMHKTPRRWADSDSPPPPPPPDLPVQTTFRQMPPSPAAAARIEVEARKLQRYCDAITHCHVIVVAPHRHHRHGRHYEIRIELSVPGDHIVIHHEPSAHSRLKPEDESRKHAEFDAPHKDIYVVIRDAFDTARRQLEDYVRRRRGDVKRHEDGSPEAR